MPLIAIVGRPNVGKSTLFNRIVGERSAIVDDLPGVTRDRQYAVAEWAGRTFTLVDTGGYVPDSEDVMETAIREQAAVAIEEADLVLFVVDAITGLHPMDRELADILRKSQKKVRVVVNKVDNAAREPAAGEFYALGLGDPLGIAALGGRSIGDMLDAATEGIAAGEAPSSDMRLKIAVVGRPNVGKSSLVNALLQQPRAIVTPVPGTTRDAIDSILRFHGEEVLLIDTAGLRRRSRIQESVEFYSTVRTLKALDRCNVAVVVIDVQQGLEHQDLRILDEALDRRRPVLLAANKWDVIEKDSLTAATFEKALRERLRRYDFVPVMFISALEKVRVHKVIEAAKTLNAEQHRRITTGQLNTVLGEAIEQFPPKSRSGREVKINYVAQVDVAPPVFTFFCNDPDQIEESYRRFLENRIREHFGFTGVPLVLSFRRK
jgi:GTP-binding protein